jgi:hypothetical protein
VVKRAAVLTTLLTALVIGAPVAAVAETSPPTPAATDPTTRETFTTEDHPAGETFLWTVPEGVTSLAIEAAGGNGGRVDKQRTAGRGAVVSVEVAVTPGQQFEITLAANGLGGGKGGAGYGAGGKGRTGGGGGGSTAVVFADQLVALAGGGGGSSTGNGVRTGGGGNGGTPKGEPGDIAGGAGGNKGGGGDGVGPWGGPGGTGPHGSGGDVANETGGGGGAGFGGGGAGGIGGDGGGGGSTGTDGAQFSTRDDEITSGWATISYTVDAPPEATTAPSDTLTAPPADYAPIGMAAAALAAVLILLLVFFGRRRQ